MLDNKEMFEAMETMGLNAGNMEQFKQMLNINPTSLCKLPKIKVVVECGSRCEAVYGIFLYAGPLPCVSKEVVVLAIPYWKCCKMHLKLCIINLDKVVCVSLDIC